MYYLKWLVIAGVVVFLCVMCLFFAANRESAYCSIGSSFDVLFPVRLYCNIQEPVLKMIDVNLTRTIPTKIPSGSFSKDTIHIPFEAYKVLTITTTYKLYDKDHKLFFSESESVVLTRCQFDSQQNSSDNYEIKSLRHITITLLRNEDDVKNNRSIIIAAKGLKSNSLVTSGIVESIPPIKIYGHVFVSLSGTSSTTIQHDTFTNRSRNFGMHEANIFFGQFTIVPDE
jgi:hypothetical protein